MQTTARFSEVTTTQTEVIQAASVIQRDVALANSITLANSSQLTFSTRQSDKDYEVSIFHWDPATTTTVPDHVDKNKLPTYSAIIESRFEKGSGQAGITILVKGYDPNGYLGRPLFSYYDSENNEVTISGATQSVLDSISRVEFRIAANASGRASKIQIESSATPAYSLPPGVAANNISGTPECPANLTPSINARETQSSIRWNAPAGATSYTLYRYNYSNGNVLEQSWVIPNPDTTTFTDTGLAWGTTYRYAIQSAGPAGTSALCGGANNITVVPDVTNFVNINAVQQSLTAVKSNGSAESLSGPTVAGSASTKATQNVSSGKRYTVARDLTNQLAWDESFGTVNYRVYKNGDLTNPVATISSGNFVWQDKDNSFGDTNLYIVKAVNAGGESFASESLNLISPPTKSTFVAARPDSSARSDTTDNVINLSGNAAPNTTGFKPMRVTTTAASASCDLTGFRSELNFLVGKRTVTDSTVAWGSYSCYNMVGYNDAGNGQPSDDLVVKQFPGKFNVAKLTSTQYQWIDIGIGLPAGTQCWVTNTGSVRQPCNVYAGQSSSNRFAVGLFGSVENKKTDINVVWNESKNAFADYTVAKNRVQTGGIVDQGSGTTTGGAVYVNGNQSLNFKNEMPGSLYSFQVTSKAANGETRQSNTASTVTSPDIPKSLDNTFQYRGQQYGTNYTRIKAYADTDVRRGLASQIGIVATSPNGKTEQLFNAGSGIQTVYSPEYQYGGHSEYTYTRLTLNGSTTYSATIGRNGETTPGCSATCTSNFLDIPERYPTYYAGAHYRYNSGGSAAGSVVETGNNNAVDAPAAPVAPEGNGNDGTVYNCENIYEGDPNFTTEYGCDYGQGIPITPTGVTAVRTDGTVAVKWNAVANVTGYEITVTTGGNSTTTSVVGATSTTFPIAAGATSSVVVRSVNAVAKSPDSTAVSVSRPLDALAAPTNLRLASQSGTQSTVAWNAVSGATSYKVTSVANGVTSTYTTTATTYVLSTPYGSTTVASVQAIRGSDMSAKSNELTINVDLSAPAAPATFAGYNASVTSVTPNALQWSAVTCATGTAQYQVTRSVPSAATVYAWGTALNVGVTHAADTAYTYAVVSRCVDGSNISATSAAKSLSLTARYNAPAAPTTAPTANKTTPYLAGSAITFTFPTNTCYTGTTPTYNLYANGTKVGSTTATTFSTTVPATAGTVAYDYTVSCTSGGYTTGESNDSPVRSVSVVTAPVAAANFNVSRIYGKTVTLAWTGSPSGVAYDVTLSGVTKRVSNTSNGTITTTMVGNVRNTSFNQAGVQPDVEAMDYASIVAIDANGYRSATNSEPVDMAQQRIGQGRGHNIIPNGTSGASIDTRWSNSMVSADGSRATVVQADGNLVTYDISGASPTATWASSWAGYSTVTLWVLNAGGANALYTTGNNLYWCGWGCGNTTMLVQENPAGGTAPGYINGYNWNGAGFVTKGTWNTRGSLG